MVRQPYNLDASLGYLSARFSRLLARAINAEFSARSMAITHEQYSFLVQLWQQNGLPQGVLALKSARDKTTMARLAAGLEGRKLIVRLPSPGDARERLVFLSDEGKALMEEATAIVRGVLEKCQQGLDEKELEVCRSILRRACANLCSP